MVVPKSHDKLMKRLVAYDRKDKKDAPPSSEESEFNALAYDLKQGIKLLPHKMERYLELKKLLGK